MMKHYFRGGHRLWIDFGVEGETDEPDYNLKCVVRAAVTGTLAYEHFQKEAEVSITFCDNAHIKGLNAEFRNKDAVTDVLSFPQYGAKELEETEEEPVILGDIVLSLERARVQAKEVGNPYLREVAFLCIHSTLHLLGYDHETSPADEEDMCKRQKDILSHVFPLENDKGNG